MSFLPFGPKLMDLQPFLERKYAVQEQRENTNTMNAETNRQNADTTRFGAETDRQRLPIEQSRARSAAMLAKAGLMNARTNRLDLNSMLAGRAADARDQQLRNRQTDFLMKIMSDIGLGDAINRNLGGSSTSPTRAAPADDRFRFSRDYLNDR